MMRYIHTHVDVMLWTNKKNEPTLCVINHTFVYWHQILRWLASNLQMNWRRKMKLLLTIKYKCIDYHCLYNNV